MREMVITPLKYEKSLPKNKKLSVAAVITIAKKSA
jgi:hypothetical protein